LVAVNDLAAQIDAGRLLRSAICCWRVAAQSPTAPPVYSPAMHRGSRQVVVFTAVAWCATFAIALAACSRPPDPQMPDKATQPGAPVVEETTPRQRDAAQPVRVERQEVEARAETGGASRAVASPPPPPPRGTVTPAALEALRISGEKNIIPDRYIQSAIGRAGKDTIIGTYRVCVTTEGNVSKVVPMKSTGFRVYDAQIINTIRIDWRYRPFIGEDGKPTPACTAVAFIYHQPLPPPPPPPPPSAAQQLVP
jgi:hypothetical protein